MILEFSVIGFSYGQFINFGILSRLELRFTDLNKSKIIIKHGPTTGNIDSYETYIKHLVEKLTSSERSTIIPQHSLT